MSRRGFGSEFNAMVFSILYCLTNNIEFFLCSRFSNIAVDKGWQDYFLPFCPETDNSLLAKSNWKVSKNISGKLGKYLLKGMLSIANLRYVLLTDDVFWKSFNRDFLSKRFDLPTYYLKDVDSYTACKKIAQSIWKYNSDTEEEIEKRLKDLNIGANYIGFHIRRGDKEKEVDFIDLGKWCSLAREIDPKIKKIFVASDDFRVIEEIQAKNPDWEVFSLCQTSRRGYVQKEFNSKSADMRKNDIISFLTDIEVLRKSDYFIGTFSSNVGRLMALLKGKETCFGVDYEYTIIPHHFGRKGKPR